MCVRVCMLDVCAYDTFILVFVYTYMHTYTYAYLLRSLCTRIYEKYKYIFVVFISIPGGEDS